MEVAEAVEKYQVFWAMNPCQQRLVTYLPEHAAEIVGHAVKHDVDSLLAQAVRFLGPSPCLDVLKKFPAHLVMAWVEYQKNWRDLVFGPAIQYIESREYVTSYCNNVAKGEDPDICRICRICLLAWLAQLEKIDSMPSFKAALKNPLLDQKHPRGEKEWCKNCPGNYCQNLPALVRIMEAGIEAAPPLSNFL
ncbi:hypothetical protein CPB84DRAFT_1966280 [Gymnopilus junonius]|uniref:Uncharacterized protein n=1 Tax=Gymnopilus junonius TaxID=109634 RepID=A0A9P5THT2_GYMJU|nr:hypothetical protein CPB84DRAFT_1966280 [Gymnopilus junonius]